MNNRVVISDDNLSINRIEERCLNCGLCKKTCESQNNLCDGDCINCGACIQTCPAGALTPVYNYKKVLNYIKDTNKIVIANIAPAVRVAIGDEFGFEPGTFLEKELVGVLKNIGFDYVFDIAFSADVTVFEEAKEFISRLCNKTNLPQLTSCCPSWVSYVEKHHKDYIDNLSHVKSPIGIHGALVKNYFCKFNEINKDDVINVTFAPCVSKKTEIKKHGNNDTDFILTTTELAMMIRELEIDIKNIKQKEFDKLLGESSKNGLAFGVSGGVANAVVRTAYYLLNNEQAPDNLIEFNDTDFYSYANIDMKKTKIKIAKVCSVKNFNLIKEQLNEFDLIEYMACNNGCINGGGQTLLPTSKSLEYSNKRYNNLKNNNHKCLDSYENEELQTFYNTFVNEKEMNDLLHYK